MRCSVISLLLCFLASASALIVHPAVPAQQQLSVSRTAAPQMSNSGVVRVEIELEDGEPCVPRPCCPAHSERSGARDGRL